jgi:hypothetical protein
MSVSFCKKFLLKQYHFKIDLTLFFCVLFQIPSLGGSNSILTQLLYRVRILDSEKGF